MTLAATGDTWGIPGPAFLIGYLTVLAVLIAGRSAHRRIVYRGAADARLDQLGPQQVAYLTGGDRLALYSALGGLRAAGAIGAAAGKTLEPAGQLPAGSTPLDTAVYNAAGRRARTRDLLQDQWVRAAMQQLRTGLEQAGLAVSPARARALRRWTLACGVLAGVGIGRIGYGISNDKPVLYLVAAVAVTAVVTLVRAGRPDRTTRAADRGLAALRTRHVHLAPDHSPSYATYGVTAAAMGVALFGAAALYEMDPAFAAEAEIEHQLTAGGAGYSGTTAGATSCGSGGSSDGGGSSCGGGGGGGCGG